MKNRRNKIVNLFKVGILLFGVSLLLWNCEQEDVLETEKKEFVIKEHSLEDLKINTKFTSTLKLLESRKVASSKNVNSTDIYNFTIVPNNIKEVILEGITSYTLLVKRPFSTPDYFENLVIQLKEGEETKAYIIKYTPNNTVELFEEHNSFNYEGKSSVFPLNLNNLDIFSKGTTGECAPILQTWCSWDTDHVAGPSCYEANDGRLYRKYVENTNCFESGDISYGGGGGSSTTNEPDSGDVIVTSPKTWDGTPTTINEGELLASRINSILDFSLSPSELNWLEVKLIEANEIKNFLENNKNLDNTYLEEAITFVKQAIEVLMNEGEVDFKQYDITQFINNIQNPITGNPVELYLIAKYKSNVLLDFSSYSTSNEIQIGDYHLKPHYDIGNNLVFYTAYRVNSSGLPLYGIEMLIKADGLDNFQNNISLYTSAANLFYLQGIPSEAQIEMAAGDYWIGLKNMWSDAVHSPEWWAYVITSFGHAITNLPVNSTVNSTRTVSKWRVPLSEMTAKSFQGKVVVNPQGVRVTINIPDNYVPRIVNNGQGVKFVPQGTPLNSDANAIRIMKPTTTGTYPKPRGYVVFHNNNGQPINPLKGQTLGRDNWHFEF